jgi:hypothetical protein
MSGLLSRRFNVEKPSFADRLWTSSRKLEFREKKRIPFS